MCPTKTNAQQFNPDQVAAVVLCGGRGLRMGGADKGLQRLHGKTLAAIALQRLKNQHGGSPALVAINANRNLDEYTSLRVPVWPDTLPNFAGPLADMLSALQHMPEDFGYLLCVPCDSPRFPLNLLQRLGGALLAHDAEIAMAEAPDSDGVMRHQPVFCLIRTQLYSDLASFLQQGGRKIGTWADRHRLTHVAFGSTGDDDLSFHNINSLDALHQLESL